LIKPYGLNVIRVAVSLALFWFIWLIERTRNAQAQKPGIKKEHIVRFFWCGLMGVAINQMLFIKGLTMTSTIHASLLMLSTPLLIAFFAFLILKEKITILKSVGLALGIGGAILLITAKEGSGDQDSWLWGDLLVILNAISYAIYFIIVKPLMKEYHPVHVIRWIFTFGLVMILPFGWMQFSEIHWHQFSNPDFTALGFIVICGTFLAYIFNVLGIKNLGAGITGSYIYTQPAFTAIIAVFFLNEVLDLQKIIAAILIFAGVFLVTKS
jgi:drug/metabolite transporter (DMT)-like permease